MHPVAMIVMSALQPSDICGYGDARLKDTGALRAIKGSGVKIELELICRVLGVVRKEWGVHPATNAASGTPVDRPPGASLRGGGRRR